MSNYIKTWYITIYFNSHLNDVNHYQKRLSEIANALGDKSPTEVNSEVYKRGIDVLYNELVQGNGSMSDFEKFLDVTREQSKRLDEELSELEMLEQFRLKAGDEAFREHCEVHGINPDEIISKFVLLQSNRKWADIAFFFLCDLLQDGTPQDTSYVRDKAIQFEIISDNISEWDNLRQLASRKGLTKHRLGKGIWQLPKEYRPLCYRDI